MSPIGILSCVTAYSLLLFLVVWLTSRKADSESFFVGNRSSRWYVVAYGMVGASLSGITFISVPGGVLNQDLSYMQVVFGYFVGYWCGSLRAKRTAKVFLWATGPRAGTWWHTAWWALLYRALRSFPFPVEF